MQPRCGAARVALLYGPPLLLLVLLCIDSTGNLLWRLVFFNLYVKFNDDQL